MWDRPYDMFREQYERTERNIPYKHRRDEYWEDEKDPYLYSIFYKYLKEYFNTGKCSIPRNSVPEISLAAGKSPRSRLHLLMAT